MLTREEWNKFHHHLVQEVANFFKEHEVDDAWIFELTIDDIPDLVKYGKWTPYNDSYMALRDSEGSELIWEM